LLFETGRVVNKALESPRYSLLLLELKRRKQKSKPKPKNLKKENDIKHYTPKIMVARAHKLGH